MLTRRNSWTFSLVANPSPIILLGGSVVQIAIEIEPRLQKARLISYRVLVQ
jgi:hypothetical protein